MPSLIGDYVASNYRKQQVPFSRFGTRKIVWFNIGHVRTRDGGDLDNYEMNKLIDVIQTRAEIVTVGAPRLGADYGRFIVGVFEDTFNNGNDTNGINGDNTASGYNGMATTLQDALEEATDGDVSVEQIYMFGGPGQGGTGWETDNTYHEYEYRNGLADNSNSNGAGYNENSYLNPGAN